MASILVVLLLSMAVIGIAQTPVRTREVPAIPRFGTPDIEAIDRECQAFLEIAREAIRRHLLQLPRRERLIVLLYFEQKLTMKEIGAVMELGEFRISQVLSGVLQQLRAQWSAEVN